MPRATRCDKYTGEPSRIQYVAFELGGGEWKLGFASGLGTTPRVRVMPAREIAAAKQWFGLSATTAARTFVECYNSRWLIEHHGHRTLREAYSRAMKEVAA